MKKKDRENIEKNIDQLFSNTIFDTINLMEIYKKNLSISVNELEKSLLIVGILSSVNSLYEKFIKKILQQFIFLLKNSNKNTRKELKNIFSLKYNNRRELKNFSGKDISEFESNLKTENLLIDKRDVRFYNEYKSFKKIEDIFYLIVKKFEFFFTFDNEEEIKNLIIENFKKNNLTEEEIELKIIKKIDFNLMYHIEQLLEQLKNNYEKDRTNIIHGDYRQFEDISLSKIENINSMVNNSVVWFCIVYISFKKIIEETK